MYVNEGEAEVSTVKKKDPLLPLYKRKGSYSPFFYNSNWSNEIVSLIKFYWVFIDLIL